MAAKRTDEERDLARTLGAVARCAELEDDFEYRFMFDVAGNTFLQKLVPKRIMERKFDLSARGLFQSLVLLDFFTGVVAGEDGVLDNLAVIYEKLMRGEPGRRIRPGLIVAEIGLYSRENGLPSSPAKIGKRYLCSGCTCDPATLDPFYEGIGFMLLDQMEERAGARSVRSKADYKAAVFAGAVLAQMASGREAVLPLMRAGQFLDAALESLRRFSASIAPDDFQKYLA